MKTLTYKQASKLPKGGAVEMTTDHLRATAADIIARKHCLMPEAVYNWAILTGVDLQKYGHILSDIKCNTALLSDVMHDEYKETKKILELSAMKTYTSKDIPKDGSEIHIHLPKMGGLPATDATLKYDKKNFNFIIRLALNAESNVIGEREVLTCLNNGSYILIDNPVTESSHTPGPWNLVPNSGTGFNLYGNNEENLIAKIIPCFGEEKANAYLIAAAEEMLEALNKIAFESDLDDTEDEESLKNSMIFIRSLCKTAIDKAQPKQ